MQTKEISAGEGKAPVPLFTPLPAFSSIPDTKRAEPHLLGGPCFLISKSSAQRDLLPTGPLASWGYLAGLLVGDPWLPLFLADPAISLSLHFLHVLQQSREHVACGQVSVCELGFAGLQGAWAPCLNVNWLCH